MKPILVCAHIYYTEMWAELKACISSIAPYPFELFVTMVNKDETLIADIKSVFASAHIEVLANKGYDVAPFIHTLNQIDLDNYSYVIKLHTKRDMPKSTSAFRGLDGSKWRQALLSFLKTPQVFNQYLDAFEKNPQIGMQNNYCLLLSSDDSDKAAGKEVINFLKQKGLPLIHYRFVAGTMFFARASIFKDIKKLNISFDDFVFTEGHKTQLAHLFERLFGYFAYKNNLTVTDGSVSQDFLNAYERKAAKIAFIQSIIRIFYQKKVNKHGKIRIKILKIPVPASWLFKNK